MKRSCIALFAMSLCAFATAQAADRTRIVNEGGIGDQWMLADGVKLAGPGIPEAYKDRGDQVCVAVGYAIKPDGTTSDFTLLKQWSSAPDAATAPGYFEAYGQAGAGALSQWKFKPRPEVADPQRTVTVATMHFGAKDAADVAAIRAHCRISDLAAQIQSAKHKSADNELVRRELERSQRAGASNRAMLNNPGTPGSYQNKPH
jgi:hypothetical protein